MKLHAAMQQSDRMMTRIGQVTSYDAPNYCVKVTLQPEGVTTGWLPLLSQWVGNGWGLFTPPTLGDLAEVHFIEGDASEGVAALRFFNDVERPLNVPSGECWLVHKSGAFVKLTNDGKLTLNDQAGSTVVMNGDNTGSMTFSAGLTVNANVQVNGNVIASGDISDKNGAKGTLQHVRDVFDTHTHSGVTTGSGNTAVPNQTL